MAFLDEFALGEKRDQRAAKRHAVEDASITDPTNPYSAQQMYGRDFNRGREEAASGPGGWARPWALWGEALNQLGEQTGKRVNVDPRGMDSIPLGESRLYQRQGTFLPPSLQALNDAAPVVKPKGVSAPTPLRDQPLPPLEGPATTRPSPSSAPPPPNSGDRQGGRLKTVPRAWTPGEQTGVPPLPSRTLTPPDSLLSLMGLAGGRY